MKAATPYDHGAWLCWSDVPAELQAIVSANLRDISHDRASSAIVAQHDGKPGQAAYHELWAKVYRLLDEHVRPRCAPH